MRTTINWRKYPEQKPPKDAGWETVLFPSRAVGVALWDWDGWRDDDGDLVCVTHFALPEDIATIEVPEAP